MSEQNPCHGCGAVDDHPRHITIHSLIDDSLNTVKHHDCCAADGCGHCPTVVEASGGARGDELRAFLQGEVA